MIGNLNGRKFNQSTSKELDVQTWLNERGAKFFQRHNLQCIAELIRLGHF
jgi:hypothetical protein